MFLHLFFVLIRVLGVPVATIWLLSRTFLGLQGAYLGVIIVFSVLTIVQFGWHFFMLFPNLALIRTSKVLKILIEMFLEITALITYWVVYFGVIAVRG